jgi:A/G-specific adenine glycosylase
MVNYKKQGHRFVSSLLKWNTIENERQMPWKGEKDPYRIWLSEIILQQTRVEQGLAYYERFVRTFPTISSLAAAPDQSIFKLWEGLGYYSRCRNLIHTARFIQNELGGKFPGNYHEILSLKGIGPYTAAAIASFAYNQPYAVVDGNVYRVLSRIFDVDVPVDSTRGRKFFNEMANALLPAGKAGIYNQAIMDFGAVICKPSPICANCFFSRHCAAFLKGTQLMLPVKGKKPVKKQRWFFYFILNSKNAVLLRQRQKGDIWQSLYEPVLIETYRNVSLKKAVEVFEKEWGYDGSAYHIAGTHHHVQQLTHQQINFTFINTNVKTRKPIPGFSWIPRKSFSAYAFPKALKEALGNGEMV